VEEIHSNDIAYVYSDPAEPLDAFQFDDGSWYYTDVSGQDWRIFRRGVFIVCPEHESPVNMSNTWQQSSEAMDEIRKFTNYPEPEPSEGFVTMPDDLFEKLGYEEKRVDVLEYVRHYPKQIKVSKSSVLWDVDDTDIVIAFSQGIGCCDIGFGVFKCKCGNILGEMNFDCGQEYVCLFAADNVQIID